MENGLSYARFEADQIAAQLAYSKSQPSAWKDIFLIPAYRKRAVIGFMTMFFGQATATMIINSKQIWRGGRSYTKGCWILLLTMLVDYGPSIYAGLGFDTSKQLILTASHTTIGIVLNGIGALLMDRVGRVKLLSNDSCSDLLIDTDNLQPLVSLDVHSC